MKSNEVGFKNQQTHPHFEFGNVFKLILHKLNSCTTETGWNLNHRLISIYYEKHRGILFAHAPQKVFNFDVTNRWYAAALRVRKSQNGEQNFGDGSSFFFFTFVTCVKESENQPNGFVESRRKSQPSPFQRVKA